MIRKGIPPVLEHNGPDKQVQPCAPIDPPWEGRPFPTIPAVARSRRKRRRHRTRSSHTHKQVFICTYMNSCLHGTHLKKERKNDCSQKCYV